MRWAMMLCLLAASALAISADRASDRSTESAASVSTVVSQDASATRLEGEKRFRTNCGRCHQAPHKFPPRMMATIVRHMRVRATITDEDMRFILAYMTE
ncbi:MAG TPA: cytochrome c [Terriglobales bacterium]|nr:cytochrome c [Terriglobales bacterium]